MKLVCFPVCNKLLFEIVCNNMSLITLFPIISASEMFKKYLFKLFALFVIISFYL